MSTEKKEVGIDVGNGITERVKVFDPISPTSKFPICGLPIRVDTYNTCGFGCEYCFANCRKFMQKNKEFEVADLGKLRNTIEKVRSGKYSGSNFLYKLISNGYTWHCGGLSDPFQPAEAKYHITKKFVDITNEYGIHVLFSTKTDNLYGADVKPENASFQLSITNLDNNKGLEPCVPPIENRIALYRELKKEGFKVGIRIQPFIPGITSLDIVKLFHDADNFTLEGLKLVPQNKEHREYITDLLGLDAKEFTMMGLLNLKPDIRKQMYKPFINYFEENNIPFSIADNDMHNIGTNLCCCGDRLVKKATTFNSTYLSKTYGKWTKDDVDAELKRCGVCDCKCSGCFSSNRVEGCATVQDFYDKRYDNPKRIFSPEYILDYKRQQMTV